MYKTTMTTKQTNKTHHRDAIRKLPTVENSAGQVTQFVLLFGCFILFFCVVLFCFGLVFVGAPHSLRDLSSWTRD